MSSNDVAKKIAATEAVNSCIDSGMRVGLGTGSTASFAVKRLAERIKTGELRDITCASTSEETRLLAESLGIQVLPLDSMQLPLDVTIDGADEVLATEKTLVLIKGRGGALLREKIVEINSKTFVCVADEGKVVQPSTFGTTGALPLEVVQFGSETTRRAVLAAVVSVLRGRGLEHGEDTEKTATDMGVSAVYRQKRDSQDVFVSDNGNFCLDLFFKKPIPDPEALHGSLIKVVGVVETGLFIRLSNLCIIGHPDGTTTKLRR